MTTVIVELLVAGLITVLAALLARLAWGARRRRDLGGPVTEVQARENSSSSPCRNPPSLVGRSAG